MRFAKLEGLGNDYLFTEDIPKNPARAARLLCDRHYGVGADGLVLIMEPDVKGADFQIRIFNPDGSEAEMCGNAIRCLGKYLYDRGRTNKQKLKIQTLRGIIPTVLMVRDGRVYRVKADMGEPIFERSRIPMECAAGEEYNQVVNEKLYLDDHNVFEFTALSMGNPHCVIWVEDVDNFPVEKYGPMIETYSLFPNRVNVEFVQMLDEDLIKQRTWERGVGETLACGTGAAAAVVAGVLTGRIKRKSKVELKGGILEIYWSEKDNHVYMTGPCKDVFEGETNII
ncbi:MAG: diaminopimelate epimerase [Candidatus Hydrogenedentota bacterium]|nr:MAG: diaminopimelate epimerase [Candidatus Hydrogenedentota bacterium]